MIEGSGAAQRRALTVPWSLHRGPGTVSFAAVPGAAAPPRHAAGRGGRAGSAAGAWRLHQQLRLSDRCHRAAPCDATFSAPGDYVLRAVAQQQREQARAFVRVSRGTVTSATSVPSEHS